ncbi:MAG: hypothetical protein HZC42_10650 [Candidatus Eisenbacteria bacterium]|nr:hypothetical protein [Candidatus Eisenbacteria bacterium]
MRAALRAFAALALMLASVAPARAWFEETASGARGLSLGFSALACIHDVSAAYWNPAGLADLTRAQVLADVARPFGVPDLNEGALFVGARRFDTGWALGWHRLGISGAYAEDLLTLSAGRSLRTFGEGHALAAGATFKFGRVSFQPFDVLDYGGDWQPAGRVDYGAQSKGSLDAGLLWTTPWKVDLAWVGRDLLEPRYQFVEGSGGGLLPLRHELAAAFRWNRESTITAGWSQIRGTRPSVNVGMEILFYDVFAIRSGLTNLTPIVESTGSPQDFQYTGGFGIFHKGYVVDAAAATNHDLGASYRVSVLVPLGGPGSR